MYTLADRTADGRIAFTELDDHGNPVSPARLIDPADLVAAIRQLEAGHPRWVWSDTADWYPQLLAAGVRIERAIDLRLCHAIVRRSALTAESELATAPASEWDLPRTIPTDNSNTLFALTPEPDQQLDQVDAVTEFSRQRRAVAGCRRPAPLNLLLTGESVGALIAAEIHTAGLPWRADIHQRILAEQLGPRPAAGLRPVQMQIRLAQLRKLLGQPDLNPDSPAELLAGLQRAGLPATSTRSWELKRLEHPAIAPLLEYKKLSRLMTANGWNWLESWVSEGRFHPDYVVGGVVTGRWATSGGGALQLPKQVRAAVVADDGWKLVVADAAQLEPRILSGMAADEAMAAAGAAGDLYQGLVERGTVPDRPKAKIAMLSALYGSTTGDGATLMPQLAAAFPRAIGMVERAARIGEAGGVVSTHLGRSSPPPGPEWQQLQQAAYGDDAAGKRARSAARSWGRFTRNFIVQGSAAEWALCWMAALRRRLAAMTGSGRLGAAPEPFAHQPHLAYFLHDEVIVHSPAELADEVRAAVQAAADEAGRLMFGEFPVRFPLSIAVVDSYDRAKK